MREKTGKKNILILGCYGDGNLGDEAMLDVMIAGIRKRMENFILTVFSERPDETAAVYGVDAVQQLNFFKWKHWYGLLKNLNFIRTINVIKACDLFIIGGGELIRDDQGLLAFLGIIDKALIAKLFRKKIVLFNVGMGPIKTKIGRFLAKNLFEWSGLIFFRDNKSFENLKSYNIDVPCYSGIDIALMLETEPGTNENYQYSNEFIRAISEKENKKFIGVIINDWENLYRSSKHDPEERRIIFQGFIRSLVHDLDKMCEEENCFICFIPFFRSEYCGDIDIIKKVINGMKNKEDTLLLYENCSAAKVKSIFSLMDVIVGMKLHSCILAAAALKPIVAISYDEKIVKFMGAMGLERYVLTLEKVKGLSLIDKVMEANADRDNIKSIILEKKRQYKEINDSILNKIFC